MKKALLILFLSSPAMADGIIGYVADRAKEARVGYTISFDGTSGGSAFVPLRWVKETHLLEAGVGYHHQEGGKQKVFAYAGTDLRSLYRATVKKWFDLGEKLDGPPSFPVHFSTWANSYTGSKWVIGQEVGVQSTIDLMRF